MNDGSAGIKLLAAVVGFWIIMRAVNKDTSHRTLANYLTGTSGSAQTALIPAAGTAVATGFGTSPTLTTGNNPQGTAIVRANAAGEVDPIPGAIGSRLDQGFDATSKQFLAPFTGKIVASVAHDAGWRGGGYVAVQSAADPSQVEYFAEGLVPTVHQGQTVRAGQSIANPINNPYNGILGNIETGPANPKNPLQPLAQVVSNPAQTVENFYNWLRSLGAPTATSTSDAGHA